VAIEHMASLELAREDVLIVLQLSLSHLVHEDALLDGMVNRSPGDSSAGLADQKVAGNVFQRPPDDDQPSEKEIFMMGRDNLSKFF